MNEKRSVHYEVWATTGFARINRHNNYRNNERSRPFPAMNANKSDRYFIVNKARTIEKEHSAIAIAFHGIQNNETSSSRQLSRKLDQVDLLSYHSLQ